MDEQKPVETTFTLSSDSSVFRMRQHVGQNSLIIWLDPNIDKFKEDFQANLLLLQSVINEVNIFKDPDEAIDFLTEAHVMKAFLIVESAIGQRIVSLIHDIPQLKAIYIFCDDQSQDGQWTNEWIKIKGVHNTVEPISEGMRLTMQQYNRDSIAMSFITIDEAATNVDLNQLEPSFMYTQIFKETLLEMQHSDQTIKDFIQFWRDHYIGNKHEPKVIAEFEHDYCSQSAITWYTREAFLFETLNGALRTLESSVIINMGFFIRDLHQQIEELYKKQVSRYNGKSFITYRGQALSKIDFEKLLKTKGGLMSFNNFLSTSVYEDVSTGFVVAASTSTDMVGILFRISIDPSISSTPFADIQQLSNFKTEGEILFSMHSIVRVDKISKIDDADSLYQVDLKLTADNDKGLRTLTNHIREELQDQTGWARLGLLLLKIAHFDKAEELYSSFIKQTPDFGHTAPFHNNLGYLESCRGDYNKAIKYFEKALEIGQKTLPPNHPHLATSNGNIGLMYANMREYSKALEFYEKVLDIRQKTLPPNHPDLAISYGNMGSVCANMREYSKALDFYEKAMEFQKKTLPSNHPDLAISYGNMGSVCANMRQYSKALDFYEKAMEFQKKTLPSNHPDLAISYNNIGFMYHSIGEYPRALLFLERALQIFESTLPKNHPKIESVRENIAISIRCYSLMFEQ